MCPGNDMEDKGINTDITTVPESRSIVDIKTNSSLNCCAVCGANAAGTNFNVLTCSSCKAFFRRNGVKPLKQFVCRLSNNCVIDKRTRRHCAACRLRKCFALGMVKERIRSQEENNRHRALVEENRRQRLNKQNQSQNGKRKMIKEHLWPPCSSSSSTLPTLKHTEVIHIALLENAFNQSVKANIPVGFRIEAGTNITQSLNSNLLPITCLIVFLKSVSHFQRLSVDSRLILLKNNTKTLMPILTNLLNTVHNVPYIVLHPGFNDVNKKIESANCLLGSGAAGDAKLLELLLVTLLFCPSLFTIDSLMDVAPLDANSRKLIHNSFDFYTELLWFYNAHKSIDNEKHSILSFTKLITSFLRAQCVINEIHTIIERRIEIDQLHLMLQSILHLT